MIDVQEVATFAIGRLNDANYCGHAEFIIIFREGLQFSGYTEPIPKVAVPASLTHETSALQHRCIQLPLTLEIEQGGSQLYRVEFVANGSLEIQ